MRIIEEEQLGFEDVLIRPARSDINSRSEVKVFRTFKKENRHSFECIPICCANMGSIATPKMAKIFVKNGLMCSMEKHTSIEDLKKLFIDLKSMEIEDGVEEFAYRHRIVLTTGIKESLEDFVALDKEFPSVISCISIDVANGYMTKLQERVKEVRERFPKAWIIAGTVVTGDIVTDLLNCGADIIRVGIGQGNLCTTRRQTGVGRPQVSMLEDCTDAAHQIHGYTMSDGGCVYPGDVCKALGLADFVMIGSMFSGAEETAEEIIEIEGEKYKRFYGMSSEYAQNKFFGGFKSSYRSSEGRQVLVKVSGKLEDIIKNILGGLRSCLAYCGCHEMKHWQKHCVFYKVRKQLTTTYDNSRTFNN